MSKILSFDVSSVSTGWSFLLDGKPKEFGKIVPPRSYRLQEKLQWFKSESNVLLKVYFPDHIVIEETYLKNVKTLKTLMQFIGVLNLECFFETGKEPMFISPQTVRSHYKLKTKEDVFSYVQNKYKAKLKNYTFDTGNDITDSILQGLYLYEVLSAEGEN